MSTTNWQKVKADPPAETVPRGLSDTALVILAKLSQVQQLHTQTVPSLVKGDPDKAVRILCDRGLVKKQRGDQLTITNKGLKELNL